MRLLLSLLASALIAYGIGALILLRANPEVDFWHELESKRDKELAALRNDHPDQPLILFAGGSSCAFSIDPELIATATGLPAINLGGPAHAGVDYLIPRVMNAAKSGDIVILALEPHFLTADSQVPPTSLGLALQMKRDSRMEHLTHLHRLRPGATFLATWLAKCASGRLGYRYDASHHRAGGRLAHDAILDPNTRSPQAPDGQLGDAGRNLLRQLAHQAKERNIRLLYSLPWQYVEPPLADLHREANRCLLAQISEILPCVEDDSLGVSTRTEDFSDTTNHLSPPGSERRSISLAKELSRHLNHSTIR
jgi:hypothetical protein